jgi:DNA polymerase-3 subunit epsilon
MGGFMKNFYCDIETGGLDRYTNPVLTIAGVIEIDGDERETFYFRPLPFENQLITDEALEKNGLTHEKIKMEHEQPGVVHKRLLNMLEIYVDRYDKEDKFHFIGYNSNSFDIPFIRNFFGMNNDKYFGSWFFHPGIDVMALAAWKLAVDRHKIGSFSLSNVCKFVGIKVDEDKLHDAMYDIRLTQKLYKKLSCHCMGGCE